MVPPLPARINCYADVVAGLRSRASLLGRSARPRSDSLPRPARPPELFVLCSFLSSDSFVIGRQSLFWKFDLCPFASKTSSACPAQSSLRQLDDLIDALEVVIDANMNEGMALLYCQSGCLSGF